MTSFSPTTSNSNWRCRSPGRRYYPWGHPHGYAYGPHPMGGVGNALIRGCAQLDIPVSIGGPVAILARLARRPPALHLPRLLHPGVQGGAKASTLVTHVPDALASGAEIRDNSHGFAHRARTDGRATGVAYFDRDGREHFQQAKAVIVAAMRSRSPRLLLNSACPGFENGWQTPAARWASI